MVKQKKILIISIIAIILLLSNIMILLSNRQQERIIEAGKCKTERCINQTEYVNWSMSSSVELVGDDTIKLNCYKSYGSKVIIDFGYEKYAMRWNKFCDKLDENVRWLFLEGR